MTRRLTFEGVYSAFRDEGCELLEKEYKNNSTRMSYRCSCGEESLITFASFRSGSRCSKCKSKRLSAKNRKHTLDDVKEMFKNRGLTLLEDNYISTKTKMRYICFCGNETVGNFNNIIYGGQKCGECKRLALSGKNNYRWNPKLSDEDRDREKTRTGTGEQKTWRSKVFRRDRFSCVCCGSDKSGTLRAHHLDGYNWCIERRNDVTNGVTLCDECHNDFHKEYGYGDNTEAQYNEWVRNKAIGDAV